MRSQNRIVVNGFQLEEPVGQGGMGIVWRARHLGEGVDVALKFVTAEHADDPLYQEGFRREVEAAAGLSHLGIVTVFDSGSVDELVSLASEGALPTGSPWLAMEFARHGNLADVPIESWAELRVVLYDVLDALAHAHSRGVIHRDLKPENILAAEAADGDLILKLSDFGIAHVARGRNSDADHEVMGTPAFMAPEQSLGRWRDYGPWTDLYALGCVTWELCCGTTPFNDENVFALLDAHVNRPAPSLRPNFEVPRGFGEWVDRLLGKQPSERFRHAADARHALAELDPLGEDHQRRMSVRQSQHDATAATASAATLPLMLPAETIRDPREGTTTSTFPASRSAEREMPPIPSAWRPTGRMRHARTLLSGVGLGLFGLRPVPFVGRHDERDLIWSALRDVDRQGKPHCLVVEGEAGCGKSRLVEWMGQRAMELGAAHLLVATHDPMTGGTHALRDMVRRVLGSEGLDRGDTFRRVHRQLGESDETREMAAVIAHLCHPEQADDDVPNIRFESAREQYAATRTVLEITAVERPLIVWLDDVQWGADAIRFVLDSLEVNWAFPVLFIATARTESVSDRRREATLFQKLIDHDRVRRLPLERLGPDERTEQIQRMLRLPDDLVDDVARRSEGNPLFAVQLVGDWVQRGALHRTATGFELAGESVAVPDDIHALWMRRFQDVSARFGEDGTIALRVAAALGQDVIDHEWRRACETVRVTVPHRLLESLVARRLARRAGERGNFTFAHGMFRESIARDSRERGEWSRVNAACAAALDILYPTAPPDTAVRRATYHLEAGAPEKALADLLAAADEALKVEHGNQAERALEIADLAIEAADVPAGELRRGKLAMLWNQLHRFRGAFEVSDPEIETLLRNAREYGWREVEASSLWAMGSTVALYEDAERGRDLMFEASALFEEVTGRSRRPQALKSLSHVYGLQGNAELARQYGVEAHELFRARRNHGEMAWCLYYIALAERLDGNAAEALRRLEDALERARDAGFRDLQANCFNGCGDAYRLLGELQKARDAYGEAIDLWDALGSRNVAAAQFNLAMCELQSDEFDTARAMLEELVEVFEAAHQKIPLAASHVALITCAAADGDADGAWHHIGEAHPILEETRLVDPDLKFAQQRALELFREHGMVEFVSTLEQMLAIQLGTDENG